MGQHLTDAMIKRLPMPEKGNKVHYDDDVIGLGARVTAAGARSFILSYRTRTGRERRYTIGSCSNWSTTAARTEARRLRRLIDEGGDPLADIEAERAAPTVWELCDRFEQEHLTRKRPGTAVGYRNMLRLHVRPHFGPHMKVQDVAFSDIDRLHRKITAAGHLRHANAVVAMLGKMFALACRWDMRTDNPTRGIERNYEIKRKRYLSGEELAALTKALAAHEDKQAANVIRVCLLSGCRVGEARSMRWADVDLTKGVWTKLGSTVKQKTDHVVPLSAPLRHLLADIRAEHANRHPKQPLGEWVFPGAGSATGHRVNLKRDWRSLCKAAGISGLRVHDLRHSFASQLASSGHSLPLIGALLGHSNPNTTARYSHLFDDPLRAAVDRVGAVITAAGKPPPSTVVPLKRGGAP